MLNVTHMLIVLEAEGVKTGETTASQMLFALREWRENAVDPGAPPAARVKVPVESVHPEKSASKSDVNVPFCGSFSACKVNGRALPGD
jgi:hypothetical protein